MKSTKYGQALFAPFTVEVFDSKNTSYTAPEVFQTEREAILFAKKNSVPFKAILHDSKSNWREYKNGTVYSWSVNS